MRGTGLVTWSTNILKTFLTDENGATAIEYGLIAALISISIIGVLLGDDGIGAKLTDIFGRVETALATSA